MSVWSNLLKAGVTVAKGTGTAVKETAKLAGSAAKETAKLAGTATKETAKVAGKAVLHPAETVKAAGGAVKTAAGAAAVGYVGWEKLTTDKSIAKIVSDAVVGEKGTETIVHSAEAVAGLKDVAGEAVSQVGSALGNIAGGNVSGLKIAGLIAAAAMLFGRTGFLGKIGGFLLGMMILNNSGLLRGASAGLGGAPVSYGAGAASDAGGGVDLNESGYRGMRR